MVGHKKMNTEADDEAKQLSAFMENVELADTVREMYQGSFVAICGRKVIETDTEYRSLMSKIPEGYLNAKELYIGYIPKAEEVLLV